MLKEIVVLTLVVLCMHCAVISGELKSLKNFFQTKIIILFIYFLFKLFFYFSTFIAHEEAVGKVYFSCHPSKKRVIIDSVKLFCSDRGGFTKHETKTRPHIFDKCCYEKCNDYSEYCREGSA